MKIEIICSVAVCLVTCGGVLIYIGRSLQSLKTIDTNQQVLFDRTESQGKDIARIDKELTQIKTRQEDCASCP